MIQVSRCLQEPPLFTGFCIAFHFKTLNISLCHDEKEKQLWNITLMCNSLFSCLPIFDEGHGCLSWFYICWGLELMLYKQKCLSSQMNKTLHYLTSRTRYTVIHLSSSVTVSKEQWDREMKERHKIFKLCSCVHLIFSKRD